MSGVVDHDAVARRADDERRRLGLGNRPIVDIAATLRAAGVKLVQRRLGRGGPDGMYIRRGDLGFILVNSDKYLPRQRFTAAHELGHHVLGHQAAVDEDVLDARGRAQEEEANTFAANFLVPRRALQERVRQASAITPDWVYGLSVEYGVSYKTLVYRLHNCRLLPGGAEQRDDLRAAARTVVAEALEMPQPPRETVFPPEFVRQAIEAEAAGEITFERLSELLEIPETQLQRRLKDAAQADYDAEAP